MKKHSGLLFLLFSTAFFLAASFSSQGDSSSRTPPSVAAPPPSNPQPPVPPPPVVAPVSETARRSAAEIERITPVVEVWRANARTPQIPVRGRTRVLRAYAADSQPVMVRLQFDPAAHGQIVSVRPGEGAVLDSPAQGLQINANGECLVRVHLDENFNRGHFAVHCGGLMTMVILARSSEAQVEANENPRGGLQ